MILGDCPRFTGRGKQSTARHRSLLALSSIPGRAKRRADSQSIVDLLTGNLDLTNPCNCGTLRTVAGLNIDTNARQNMTITIDLPAETEGKLLARALATGKDVSTLVREAVEEK